MYLHIGNYKAYREALRVCTPPAVPYLGVYLTDLTFIEEGNKTRMKREGKEPLVNFAKGRMMAEVIHEIQKYQQIPFPFPTEMTVMSYLQEVCRTCLAMIHSRIADSGFDGERFVQIFFESRAAGLWQAQGRLCDDERA